jgi:hypothetical protein
LSETGRVISNKPDEYLMDLRSNLAAQPGCDPDLLGILAEHILVPSPQSDCVAKARRAIGQLAKARAESAQGAPPDV